MAKVADLYRLVTEWGPALSMLSALSAAASPKERASLVVRLARFAATKTETKVDDVLLEKVQAVIESQPGAELVEALLVVFQGLASAEVEP